MLQPHSIILPNMKLNYWNNLSPFLLFLFDYNLNMLLNKQLCATLLCWFLITSYNGTTITYPLAINFILLGLSSFLYYGYFGLIYVSVIPTIILMIMAKKWFTRSLFTPALILLLSLTANNIITGSLLDLPQQSLNYTMCQFCVNMVVLLIMSLKIHGIGRLGNRL